jgi:hypothetical protein
MNDQQNRDDKDETSAEEVAGHITRSGRVQPDDDVSAHQLRNGRVLPGDGEDDVEGHAIRGKA